MNHLNYESWIKAYIKKFGNLLTLVNKTCLFSIKQIEKCNFILLYTQVKIRTVCKSNFKGYIEKTKGNKSLFLQYVMYVFSM